MKYQLGGVIVKKFLIFVTCVLSTGAFAQQSPNWDNNPNNYNSQNGVYDSQGNRTGYSPGQ
jgi:hypothetical protein